LTARITSIQLLLAPVVVVVVVVATIAVPHSVIMAVVVHCMWEAAQDNTGQGKVQKVSRRPPRVKFLGGSGQEMEATGSERGLSMV
jgi:hypothetical protein